MALVATPAEQRSLTKFFAVDGKSCAGSSSVSGIGVRDTTHICSARKPSRIQHLLITAFSMSLWMLTASLTEAQTVDRQNSAKTEEGAAHPNVIVIESMTTTLIRHVNLSTRDAGMLKSLNVRPGDPVTVDQILGSLDDELQELAVQQAESALQIAELKAQNIFPIQTAKAQIREAEQELVRLESAAAISSKQASSDVAVRVTEKNKELAEFELNRALKAKESFSGSMTKVELNRLQVQLDQRNLEIEKAQEDRALAAMKPAVDQAAIAQQTETIERQKILLDEKEQDQKLALAAKEIARTELALAKLQLQRRRLLAPFAGEVVSVSRQPGEWVEQGTEVLRLIELNTLRVEGFTSADVAKLLRAGQAASIQFADSTLPVTRATVTFISPEIDPVNQRVLIWAEFPNPDRQILPGLIASMQIALTVDPSSTGGLQDSPKD